MLWRDMCGKVLPEGNQEIGGEVNKRSTKVYAHARPTTDDNPARM